MVSGRTPNLALCSYHWEKKIYSSTLPVSWYECAALETSLELAFQAVSPCSFLTKLCDDNGPRLPKQEIASTRFSQTLTQLTNWAKRNSN